MVIISNAINYRPAMIAHCNHETLIEFKKQFPTAPMAASFPELWEGDKVTYSTMPTHWNAEPSALRRLMQWLDDSGYGYTPI